MNRVLLVGDMNQVPEGRWIAPLLASYLIALGQESPSEPVWLLMNRDYPFDNDTQQVSDLMRFVLPYPIGVIATSAYDSAVLLVASGTKGKRYVAPDGLFLMRPFSVILDPYTTVWDERHPEENEEEGEEAADADADEGESGSQDPLDLSSDASAGKTNGNGAGENNGITEPADTGLEGTLRKMTDVDILINWQVAEEQYRRAVAALETVGTPEGKRFLKKLLTKRFRIEGPLYRITPADMVRYGFADAILSKSERGILFRPPTAEQKSQ